MKRGTLFGWRRTDPQRHGSGRAGLHWWVVPPQRSASPRGGRHAKQRRHARSFLSPGRLAGPARSDCQQPRPSLGPA